MFLNVIGPLSYADDTQKTIHRLLKSQMPKGWHNQIPNDIVVNYNVMMKKEMFYLLEKIMLLGFLETYTGTMYDAMGVGFLMDIGNVDNLWIVADKDGSKKNKCI